MKTIEYFHDNCIIITLLHSNNTFALIKVLCHHYHDTVSHHNVFMITVSKYPDSLLSMVGIVTRCHYSVTNNSLLFVFKAITCYKSSF
jgi:radical SAM superfamily enzyme